VSIFFEKHNTCLFSIGPNWPKYVTGL